MVKHALNGTAASGMPSSVRTCKKHSPMRWFPRHDAPPFFGFSVERDASDRRFRAFLDERFGLGGAHPSAP